MKEIALIVVYNKQINESLTIKTLIHSDYSGDVYIFNNGPYAFDINSSCLRLLKDKCGIVKIVEDLNNRPLSNIYNDFFKIEGYDLYYLFDDDTTIPTNLFALEKNTEYDLFMPLIISSKTEEFVYPIVNNKVVNRYDFPFTDDDQVVSIGSGLVISKSLILKFKQVGMTPFDERFALYGVDYSLFRRFSFLKRTGLVVKVGISGVLHHSLSSEEHNISEFRKRERLIDLILTKIHYSKRKRVFKTLSILKTLGQLVIDNDFANLKLLTQVWFRKEHPRSTQYKIRLRK